VKKKYAIMCILLILLKVNVANTYPISCETSWKYTIVIDASHGLAINVSALKTGIENITALIEREYNITIDVWVFKDGRINKTALSGVNIWLIPPLNGSIFYKTFEINALKWFLEEGGILIISSSAYISYNPHPNPLVLNDILRGLELETKVRFYHYEGIGDTLYDSINGLVNGCIINITTNLMSEELRNYLNKSLIIRSSSIEILVPSEFLVINAPPTAFSLNGNLSVSYGNFSVFAMNKTRSGGAIVLLGFAEVLTNETSPLGVPWLKLGDNLQFIKNLLIDLLQVKQRTKPQILGLTFPLYLIYFALGAILLVLSVIELRQKPKKIPRRRT